MSRRPRAGARARIGGKHSQSGDSNQLDRVQGGRRPAWPDRCVDQAVRGRRLDQRPWTSNSPNKIDWARGGRDHVLLRQLPQLEGKSHHHAHAPRDHAGGCHHLLDNLDDNVNVGLMRYSNDGGSGERRPMAAWSSRRWPGSRTTAAAMQDGHSTPGALPALLRSRRRCTKPHQYFSGDKVYLAAVRCDGVPERIQQVGQVHEQSQRRHAERRRPRGNAPGKKLVQLAADRRLPEELHRLPDGRPADPRHRVE